MPAETLAIIPARGGSVGIPRKNVISVAGKPLILWTLEAARAAPGLTRVILSTDDAEIAEVAHQGGFEVPFLRPAELARADTPSVAPALHALRWLDEHGGYRPDYVMLLQPTSPFRSPADIEAALHLAVARDADSVVSVVEVKHHPYWTLRFESDGSLAQFSDLDWPALQAKYPRRQDLPAAYAENGAIFLAKRSILLERGSFYGPKLYGYTMPSERSLDIDTPWDLRLADLILRQEAL